MLTLKLGGRFPCWGFVFVSTGWFNHRLVVEWTFWCRTLQSHGGTWVMTWTLLSFFFGQVHSERVPCKFWNCLKFSSSTSRFEKSIIYSLKIYTWNQGRDTFASTFIYIHVFVNKIDIQNTQQKTQTHTHMVHLKIEPISEVRVPQPITPWQDVLDLPGVTWQHFVCCLHPPFQQKRKRFWDVLKPQHIFSWGCKTIRGDVWITNNFLLGAIIVGATFAFPGRNILYPESSTIRVLEVGNVFKETSIGPL